MTTHSPTSRLALFGALAATFDLLHDALDQWVQTDFQAGCKDYHGPEPVDGERTELRRGGRNALRTRSAGALGRQAATHHVAIYTTGQITGAVVVTRAMGMSTPWRALAAGALVNATTHWIIDRRRPLLAAARLAGKSGYLNAATVVRRPGQEPETTGPGTALFELDRSAHRVIGLGAALLTAWLATRNPERRMESRP